MRESWILKCSSGNKLIFDGLQIEILFGSVEFFFFWKGDKERWSMMHRCIDECATKWNRQKHLKRCIEDLWIHLLQLHLPFSYVHFQHFNICVQAYQNLPFWFIFFQFNWLWSIWHYHALRHKWRTDNRFNIYSILFIDWFFCQCTQIDVFWSFCIVITKRFSIQKQSIEGRLKSS